MKSRPAILLAGFVAILAGAVICFPSDRGRAAEPATYVGSELCQGCHPDAAEAMLHMKVLPAAGKTPGDSGCEACHGPGSLHPGDPDHGGILNPKKLAPDKVAATCMKCHKQFTQAEWKSSEHARNKIPCTECHSLHQTGAAGLLRAKQPGLCEKCHRSVKGELNLTSHHPVREGRLVCSDCHNPHSGRNAGSLTKPDASALCVTCHAEKRGPFKYEHDPNTSGMADGCMTCHKPHGSSNRTLLKVAGRGVCLQCHATVVAPGGSHADFFPSGVGGADCLDCHAKIHGSNRSELFFQ